MKILNLIHFLPKSHLSDSPEMQRKWSILLVLSSIYIFVQCFYLHRYYYFHNSPSSTYVIFPMIILNIISFYFFFKKRFNFATNLVLIPVTMNIYYMVYMGGGINAPATYWVAFFPFMYSIFHDKKGMLIGAVVSLLALFSYLILDVYAEVPMVAAWPTDYKSEKTMNLFNYLFVMVLIYYSFSTTYEKANHKLDAQRERIDNLFRVVLHDITNPLSAATLRMSLMKKSNDYSDALKVENSLAKIGDIIKSLRDFKAIEDGSVVIKMKPESIETIIDKFVKESKDLFLKKSLSFNVNSDGCNGKKVNCHRESLVNQIFFNLLTNAIKFSPENSSIYFSAYSIGKEVCFELRDEGIGIPGLILKDLFKFDKSTSRTGTQGEEGTGYGMPIAKYFVKAMNGRIEVESTEKTADSSKGHGTTFKIIIPEVITG